MARSTDYTVVIDRKHNPPTRSVDFRDVGHLVDVAKCVTRTAGSGSRQRASAWNGNVDFDGAEKLARVGWPEGRDKADKLRAELTAAITGGHAYRPKLCRSVAGFAPCVPAAIAGDPESMFATVKRKAPSRGKIVHVVYNTCVSAGISADTLILRGSVLLALVDLLEGFDYRCQVTLAGASDWNGYRNQVFVDLKEADEPANTDTLAFWLAHPASFRRMLFGAWENAWEEDIPGGYGRPSGISADRQGDIYASEAYLGDVSNTTAIPFLKAELSKFGVTFED